MQLTHSAPDGINLPDCEAAPASERWSPVERIKLQLCMSGIFTKGMFPPKKSGFDLLGVLPVTTLPNWRMVFNDHPRGAEEVNFATSLPGKRKRTNHSSNNRLATSSSRAILRRFTSIKSS